MDKDRGNIQILYDRIEFLESQIEHYDFICKEYKDLCFSYSEILNKSMDEKINDCRIREKISSRCF